MEDVKNHYFKYKRYPLRTFIHKSYNITYYKVNSDNIEKEMKEIQRQGMKI